ncbi:MAG: hypothetical protein R3C15_17575 [Thermoleophilia bacterium]
MTATTPGPDRMHRVLVLANETADSAALRDALELDARRHRLHALVVAPALNTRLRTWTSDDRAARTAAAKRVARCVGALQRRGVSVEGCIGDADPLLALQDALWVFPADEIVVVTHPAGSSRWLDQDVVERARAHGIPVAHVVAAPARELRRPSRLRALATALGGERLARAA